jgi:hypothetical protein
LELSTSLILPIELVALLFGFPATLPPAKAMTKTPSNDELFQHRADQLIHMEQLQRVER